MPNGDTPGRVIHRVTSTLLIGKACWRLSSELTVDVVSTVTEPENMQQLIADCHEIPHSLDPHPALVLPRTAPRWEVTEKCQAQVADLDEYV